MTDLRNIISTLSRSPNLSTQKVDVILFFCTFRRKTYPSPEDLDADFMCFGRSDFNVFNGQFSSSFPRNRRLPRNQLPSRESGEGGRYLACNCLSSCIRHFFE